jgi:citrate lyase subunit gamma (acyl carrier protein)
MIINKKALCGTENKSDCLVSIEPANELNIEIQSKVEKLFGPALSQTVHEVVEEHHIEKACIVVKDFGALDWTIRARLECAIQRAK